MKVSLPEDLDKYLYRDYRKPYKSILLVLSASVSDFRLGLIAKHLIAAGYSIEVVTAVPMYLNIHHDLIICIRPNQDLCRFLLDSLDANRPVIIDIDDDFASIPEENPSYSHIGPGNKEYLDILLKTVAACTRLVVATDELVNRYGRDDAVVIKNYVDEDNELWGMTRKPHPLTIGWGGTITHREDFNLCQPAIMRILQERPDVRIVIGVDQHIFNRFKDIPESQKLFIPALQFDIYPALYSYMDIVLAPLIDNHFNRSKSDVKLLDSGMASLPFVASPLPQYIDWGGGGLYAETEEDWYRMIMALIIDRELATRLGIEGRNLALKRTSAVIFPQWLKVIEELLA